MTTQNHVNKNWIWYIILGAVFLGPLVFGAVDTFAQLIEGLLGGVISPLR